jgi:hypothetical protein
VVASENVMKLAVIYDQTEDGQRDDADVCKFQAGTIGYELVAYEAFRSGDPDLSPPRRRSRCVVGDRFQCRTLGRPPLQMFAHNTSFRYHKAAGWAHSAA